MIFRWLEMEGIGNFGSWRGVVVVVEMKGNRVDDLSCRVVVFSCWMDRRVVIWGG